MTIMKFAFETVIVLADGSGSASHASTVGYILLFWQICPFLLNAAVTCAQIKKMDLNNNVQLSFHYVQYLQKPINIKSSS